MRCIDDMHYNYLNDRVLYIVHAMKFNDGHYDTGWTICCIAKVVQVYRLKLMRENTFDNRMSN